VNQFGWHMRS